MEFDPKMSTDLIEVRLQRAESFLQDPLRRVLRDLTSRNCFSTKLIRVPSDYYERQLDERARLLKAVSTGQLCKSIIFENTECGHDGFDDPSNSKYYCVVVQYDAKFNAEVLRDVIHCLRRPEDRLPKKAFHFRLATEADNDRLTGFPHNAVSPFGTNCRIPIVLCSRIASGEGLGPPGTPLYIYLGGGEVDVKLGMGVQEFIRVTNPIIAKISEARV